MKKAVPYTTTLMQWKDKQVLRNLFGTNQANGSGMTFVAGATKINLKNLKTWRHQLYSDRRFEPSTNSSRRLTWAYKLKPLKSSSQISSANWLNIFLIHVITVICIALLLPMQQFYVTKMMMLIFTIIVMRLYLFSVCMVCWVLKNMYFKEHPWMIASKYSMCDSENNTWEFKLCSMFKLSPKEKVWFFTPVEYSSNGKGIMAPMEYKPMVYSPNGKGMVSWKILFRSGNGHSKR